MEEKRRLIEQVCENEYSRDGFKNLIANISKSEIEDKKLSIALNDKEKNYFDSATFIDDFKTSDDRDIAIIEVKLKRGAGIVKPRYYQRDFIAKYLKNNFKDGAFVAFYMENHSDWRFSFVKIDYKYENGRPLIEKSSAVRYTYLVGKNEPSHTAKKQLYSLLESLSVKFDDILSSFSIEKVSKEFFREYEALYKKLLEDLKNNKTFLKLSDDYNLTPESFAKKLLGRIVFLYFIQKKGWLGVPKNKVWGEGDKNFLYNLYIESTDDNVEKKYLLHSEKSGNFYNDVLEHLFYDALNKQNLDSVSRDYHSYFNSKIPFLNGGLFEQEYDWKNSLLFIKNDIFKNILDTFNRYNFTVKEEDPLDKDVAVDPEMLGKIFENLLAQEERKKSGSFYTPRPIVYYMVKESLFYYLKEHLKNISEQDIRMLIDGNIDGWNSLPPDSIFDNAETIDELLENIRVADPAVGSGAFIVSMLQEITHMRIILTEYFDNDKRGRTEYKLKKYAIEKSIYGVDIDPGAVDIAKLRLWLSLVVEHDIDEIEPLPNLDYKIMCGNSLIDELIIGDTTISLNPPKAGSVFDPQLNKILEKHEKNRKNYFNTYNEKEKAELKFAIEESQKEYIQYMLNYYEKKFDYKIKEMRDKFLRQGYKIPDKVGKELSHLAEKINKIEKLKKDFNSNKLNSFFPWKFEFSEIFREGGFDIVIGNPPYIEARNNKLFPNKLKNIYQNILKKRWGDKAKLIPRGSDLLIYFFELSLFIMNNKGINSFITQNAWLSTDYGKKFQDFLIQNKLSIIIEDSNIRHFTSNNGPKINTIISFIKKGSFYNKITFLTTNIIKGEKTLEKKYFESDDNLLKYKWGTLFKSPKFILELFLLLNNLGSFNNYSVGQGLNIRKSFVVDKLLINKFSLNKNSLFPIFTNDDGAPYIIDRTTKFIINKYSLTSYESKQLIDFNIDLFVPSKERKIPTIILPRGLGRYFAAFNIIQSYSTSYVEVYIKDLNISKNIWLFLNSSIGYLIREITGRTNLGGGMLKAEATDLKYFPLYYKFDNGNIINKILNEAYGVQTTEITRLINTDIHKKIDEIVFNHLKIKNSIRKKIIDYLIYLVKSRELKAKT